MKQRDILTLGNCTGELRLNVDDVGFGKPADQIDVVHRKVDHAIVRAGLEPERRAYLPHITLARLSGSAGPVDRWLAEHTALASEPFAIDAMILYESRLGHGGASYEPIARYPLTGS